MGAVGSAAHRGHLLRLRAVAPRRRPTCRVGHGQPRADGAGAARRHGQGPGAHPGCARRGRAARPRSSAVRGADRPGPSVVRRARAARVARRRPARAVARSDAGARAPRRRSRGGPHRTGRRPGRGHAARRGLVGQGEVPASRPGAGATRSSLPGPTGSATVAGSTRKAGSPNDGKVARDELEAATDAAALAPWEAFGLENTTRLAELVAPLARTVLEAGVLPRSVAASKVS